jgi:hypothetical protein
MCKSTLLSCVAIAAIMACLCTPSSHAQEEGQRFEKNPQIAIVSRYFRVLFSEPLNDVLTHPSIFDVSVSASKERFAQAVAATFKELRDKGFMNEKMTKYERYWDSLQKSPPFTKPDFHPMLAPVLASYGRNLILAAEGNRCTVSASASKGTGAVVKCAKAADAKSGPFVELGITTAQAEVEKAAYVFIAYRNNKETGRTDQKDCTGSNQTVDIPEQ